MTETEITGYVPKNIITRSLGPAPDVTVDLEGPYPLEAGDTFLLCSDGLSGQVRDEEIGAILNVLPPTEAARVLIDLANLRGGPDNITVIVAKVNQTDPRWSSQRRFEEQAWLGASARLGGDGCVRHACRLHVDEQATGHCRRRRRDELGRDGGCSLAMAGTKFGRQHDCRGARHSAAGHIAPTTRTPTLRLIEGFQQLIEPVCQTAQQQQWAIDWSGYEKLHKSMQANVEKQDYAAALRDICRAIAFLMQEVRNQRDEDSDESA